MSSSGPFYLFNDLLLKAGVRHAFFGRMDAPSTCPTNKRPDGQEKIELLDDSNKKCFDLSQSDILTVEQVHGACVTTIKAPLMEDSYYKGLSADAIVTGLNNTAIGVKTADCLPILLFDTKENIVSAVHAGWRSTVRQVVKNAVATMAEGFGSSPDDIIAAMGPRIKECCYEVGPELLEEFRTALGSVNAFTRSEGGLKLDLARANRDQLLECGLSPERISTEAPCTVCRNDLFYSYRVEKQDAGRQISFIKALA